MLYAFELSGEHQSLPVAEVLGTLTSRNLNYTVFAEYKQCLVADIFSETRSDNDIFQTLKDDISKVLAMSHTIFQVIDIVDVSEDDVLGLAENFPLDNYLKPGQTFVVRAKRMGDGTLLKSVDIEGRIGGRIFRRGFRADLSRPDVVFRLTLTDKAVFGVLVSAVDRGSYEHRSPQRKPFFYPGVLMPRVARALVNMAGVKENTIVVDPFCGTAGILMEAGLLGAKVFGVDAQEKIIEGAGMNMAGYSITGELLSKEEREKNQNESGPASCGRMDYELLAGDACRLPFKNEIADAIVTDPPYGRSAAIKAESLEGLYEKSFLEMYRILKKNGKAVVVSEIEVEKFAKNAGFEIQKTYKQRVHRSLTRTMTVLEKK
ncbi:TRM11 family methyltransferase [Methanolapillus millepedarum]|uniref:tRNA (guanine(10)-N(2))-dimethyltransferase n=1 Tax=Methanolapillus millepedarum TaxID=3028296 RepID=A0AA96V3E0_9EURY|nr:hypothetical protein MsAc7_09280 [Methanosarcinaceae archaeon Ac7]